MVKFKPLFKCVAVCLHQLLYLKPNVNPSTYEDTAKEKEQVVLTVLRSYFRFSRGVMVSITVMA